MDAVTVTQRGGTEHGLREFAVRVGNREHHVTVSDDDARDLAAGASADDLVRESFAFLLEREPAGSILASFDLSVISRYFPEYRTEIRRRLRG